MQLDRKLIKKLALGLAGVVVLVWLLYHFELVGKFFSAVWAVIFPFVLGFILAFLLNIPMRALEKHLFRGHLPRLRRPLSFALSVILVLAVVAFVIFMVVPQLVDTFTSLAQAMPGYIRDARKFLTPYLEYVPAVQAWVEDLNINWPDVFSQFSHLLQNGAGSFFSSAVDVATNIVNGVVSFFVGIVFSAYLLLDKEHLIAQLKGLLMAYLPQKRYSILLKLGTLTERTYARFVAGQCTEAVIIAVLYLLCLSIGGFQYPLLISVFIGFCSLVPLIGSTIGCIVGTLLILISMGFWRALAFVILFLVVQTIEGNLIYPHVVGTSVGLSPIWILLAVMVGSGIGGIFGILFFIPLFSVIYTLLYRHANNRLKEKGLVSPVAELAAEAPLAKPKKPQKTARKKAKKEEKSQK